MRTERRFPWNLFGSLLLIAILGACEDKPDFIGGDLLPSGDSFSVYFDSTEIIYGHAIPADSIASGYKNFYLVGSITDPFLGRSRSDAITTISPSINSRGFGEGARADSVILYLVLENRIGEGNLPLRLQLYELTEQMHFDSTYYSNMDMTGKYRNTELGSVSVSGGDTIVQIFITESDFINRFLNAEDTVLKSADNLQEFMNGFYLKTNDAIDEGSMVQINFEETQNYLYFYYRNDTATEQKQYYSLESKDNGRVNMFHHDPAGYPVEEYLQNGSDNDSLLFVQSMAGISSIIRFPGLTKWADSMNIAINEARLILPIADTNVTMQNSRYFPEFLNMFLVQENEGYSLTYDHMLNADGFGGKYDSYSRSYSFSIKVHLQSLIAGDIKNLDMILIPGKTNQTVSKGVLYGWNQDPGKRIRLEIIYTKL